MTEANGFSKQRSELLASSLRTSVNPLTAEGRTPGPSICRSSISFSLALISLTLS